MSVHIKEEVVDLEPVYIKTEVAELESDYIQEEVFEPEPVSVKTEIPAVEFAHMEGDRAVQFLSFNSCQHHILKESDSGSESVDFDVEQTEDDTPDEDEEDEVDDMEGQTDKSSQHWPSTKLKEFEWSLDPPVMEFSLPKIVGVKEGLSPQCSKLEKAEDFFKFLFDSTTVHTVVECTNNRIDREARVKHDSVMQHVTEHEVYAFIGVCILLGVLHKRNVDVHEIWSEKKGHLHRVHWATVAMSRQRFTLLSSLLTFDDIDTRASRCAQDPGFFKMQDIFERVRKKCCTAYQPGGHLTVDETLYPYRDKCSLRRHIPKKPPRYGLKLWEMVDVESGYLCNFNIYLGNKAGTTARDLRMTAALNLAKPFYNSGRNISTDKLFTSVELADKLWQQGLTLVGAIENREEIPKKALLPSGRPAKSTDFYFASYRTLVSYVPEKQATINLLSTMHHDKVVDTNTDRKKPLVLLYFNSTKGGCATFSKTVEEFSCRRTTQHWSLRLLQYLIDAMAANTFVLTKKAWGLQKMTQVFGTEKQHRRHFLEHLAQTLIRPLAEVQGKQMVQSAQGFSRDYLGKKMARRELSEEAVANLLAESGSECDFVPDDSGSEYEPSGTSSSEETNSGQEEEPMETEPEPLHETSTSRGPGLRDGRFQVFYHWTPPNITQPQIPNFSGTPGTKVNTTGFTPINFFQLFITDDIFEYLVTQTNLYGQQYLAQHCNNLGPHSRVRKWVPTNAIEMKKFWGLSFLMGLGDKPRIDLYWSTNPVHAAPIFPSTMSRDRFQLLLKFLHYNDNAKALPRDHPQFDSLFKLRPLLDHLQYKFKEIYTPGQNIAVDESLLLFKGRIIFKQYIPMKRARYGIKLYKLCESSTGYTHQFRLYTGKETRIEPPGCPPDLQTSDRIVWDLVVPLLNLGYHMYVDDFCTGIPLFRALYTLDTMACGTIRPNRKGFPRQLVANKQRRGKTSALRCEELLAVKYTDKKDVYLLTTIHDEATVAVPVRGQDTHTNKPKCVLDYNKYMGGVDRSDQMLESYNAARKTMALYKKLGMYMVQISLYNAYVVYLSTAPEPQLTFLEFQTSVIASLLFDTQGVPETERSETVARLRERHFVRTLPQSGRKANPQKRCRVCSRNGIRRDTRYHCPRCPSKPGLCLEECFEKYHTVYEYWKD